MSDRYWLKSPLCPEINIFDQIKIEGSLYDHIFRVCRSQCGDQFELLNEQGVYLVEVIEVKKTFARVKVLEINKGPALLKPYLHLVLGVSKPKTMERVIEKSVELGIRSLNPVESKFSSRRELKENRVEKIMLQAMQQTRRVAPLRVFPPMGLDDFLDDKGLGLKSAKGFFLYESSLTTFNLSPVSEEEEIEDVFFAVGSEGGWSQEEASLFKAKGWQEVSLGKQILRVETACVAGASILKSHYNLWG